MFGESCVVAVLSLQAEVTSPPILHSVLIASQTAREAIVNGGLERTGDASVAVVHPPTKNSVKGCPKRHLLSRK